MNWNLCLRSILYCVIRIPFLFEYNFKDNGSFIVVSGDDRAYPVLGYSLKGNIDYNSAPPVFLNWLQGYRGQIPNAVKTSGSRPSDPARKTLEDGLQTADLLPRKAVGPLGTAEWEQHDLYIGNVPQSAISEP